MCTLIYLLSPQGAYFFPSFFEGGLLEKGGGVISNKYKSPILFYLWTDLILNKIQKRTSVVTTELW